jgi:uncharacterized protein involved in outer membrane biogenesis
MDASLYKPRRNWPLILAGLVGFLAVLFFVATSGWFVRTVVLPQVATKLGSELTAEEISISPFSRIELRKVRLTPRGADTLLAVELVRVHYGLFAILGGNIEVSEITVESPTVTVVGKLAGDGNLAKLLAALNAQPKSAETQAGETPKLNLRNLSVKGATLRYAKETAPGAFDVCEVSGLNVTLDQLGNGQSGKLTLGLAVTLAQATNRLTAKGDGAFTVGLDAKLMPSAVAGQLKLGVGQAAGVLKEFANSGAELAVDVTATELKQLKLAFSRGADALGSIVLSGPYDLAKKEARISYSLDGIDRRALGIAAAATGVGFGDAAISASGRVDLAQFGQLFASNGKLTVNQFSLVLTNGASPVLDLALDYKFSVNLTDQTALAEKVDLKVRQVGRDLVTAGLDRPMNLAWDRTAPGFREATLTLAVNGLELSEWRALGGPMVPSGALNLTTKVTADRDGRLLKLDLAGGIDRLTGEIAGAKFSQLQVGLSAGGSLEHFMAATLDRSEVVVRNGAEQVVKLTAFANQHRQQNTLGVQAAVDLNLPQVLRIYPVAGAALRSGSALASVQAGIRPGATNVSVNVSVSGLSGAVKDLAFVDYEARVQAEADLTFNNVTLQRLTVVAQSGSASGGSIDLTGKFDPQAKTGDFTFKSVGFNEGAIGPFIAAALAPNRLQSISLDGEGTGTIALDGESAFRAQLRLQNFVAVDPAGKLPKTPLALGLLLDAAQRADAVMLRQVKLDFGATPRAENQLLLSGKLDLATNNPSPSSLKVGSSGLDFTPLYDLFAGPDGTTETKPEKTPASVSPAKAESEPDPLVLPLRRFDFDLNIAKLFLREVAVSNWVTQVKLDGGKLAVEPLALSLNGAPVRAAVRADLGVKGYAYDLNFGATNIPVTPLAKSFLTGPQMHLHGNVNAGANLKGAGITAPSLRKNLAGDFGFAATGLDYEVSAVKSPLLKTLVTVLTTVLRLPNVSQSPIDALAVSATAGQGIVRLANAKVASPAFLAEVGGQIGLADVLTNSELNLPVAISIPKDGKMDRLPDFLTIRGTVGKPESSIDKIALVQVAARLPGGIGSAASKGLNQLGGALEKATGGLVPNVGGLLTGQEATNSASTNKTAGLGGVWGGIFGTAKSTNAPVTNAAPLNPFDLLKPTKQP